MAQTWFINGRHMNREQVMAWRASQNAPKEVPFVEQKVELPTVEAPEAPLVAEEVVEGSSTPAIDERTEFEQMKKARAWVKPELKARYDELKAKFNA